MPFYFTDAAPRWFTFSGTCDTKDYARSAWDLPVGCISDIPSSSNGEFAVWNGVAGSNGAEADLFALTFRRVEVFGVGIRNLLRISVFGGFEAVPPAYRDQFYFLPASVAVPAPCGIDDDEKTVHIEWTARFWGRQAFFYEEGTTWPWRETDGLPETTGRLDFLLLPEGTAEMTATYDGETLEVSVSQEGFGYYPVGSILSGVAAVYAAAGPQGGAYTNTASMTSSVDGRATSCGPYSEAFTQPRVDFSAAIDEGTASVTVAAGAGAVFPELAQGVASIGYTWQPDRAGRFQARLRALDQPYPDDVSISLFHRRNSIQAVAVTGGSGQGDVDQRYFGAEWSFGYLDGNLNVIVLRDGFFESFNEFNKVSAVISTDSLSALGEPEADRRLTLRGPHYPGAQIAHAATRDALTGGAWTTTLT